KKQWIR
ncbi:diguanylate cyclase domain protein, partial [Vibrio parahaemolyticus VPTS-2010]